MSDSEQLWSKATVKLYSENCKSSESSTTSQLYEHQVTSFKKTTSLSYSLTHTPALLFSIHLSASHWNVHFYKIEYVCMIMGDFLATIQTYDLTLNMIEAVIILFFQFRLLLRTRYIYIYIY